jgi:putative glutamine amidotransferase
MSAMRILLTLDRDAGRREENDYVRSLMRAGFQREEIDLLEPGSLPPEEFDGVLLGGGCDVDPRRYGHSPRPDAGLELDAGRDKTDFAVFDRSWRAGVPIFGICRGLQVVNVALGGTLFQDIGRQRPSSLVHQRPPRQTKRLDHQVDLAPGTRLASIARSATLPVNSRHHQAILDLAPGLSVSAVAPDGLVEGVEIPDRPLLAVQWHPENLDDSVSCALFDDFARTVRQGSARGISDRPALLSPA